jgi:hypothetical protein
MRSTGTSSPLPCELRGDGLPHVLGTSDAMPRHSAIESRQEATLQPKVNELAAGGVTITEAMS